MTILITGANRGIGRAMFDGYRDRGDKVIGTHRDAPSTDWIRLDVTDPGSAAQMAKDLVDTPIDLLVCNAGVFLDRGQSVADLTADTWAKEFAVNVTGVFLTVQSLLPNIEAAGGKIAIISSQLGSDTKAAGGNYVYRASKAAVLNFGLNLAADLKDDGIAVGIYHPGWVQTDMGGSSAAITPGQAADGLLDRFAELSVATTGCFKTWDGQDHPY
ncbi:SDR family NAD(P)-dependent oxidoreductase [Loktanella salsilacus]|uniref:SDR family NAD(P)-dependent oxidoreductase n=1 Tax=Loktanella salsilacus TaxID=195913 RepID=UPI003735C5BB